MSNSDPVFRRAWGRRLPRIVKAEGLWLQDSEGRRYLDAVGGIYVVNIGHGVEAVAEAMARQAREIAFVYGGSFETEAENALAAAVLRLAPQGFAKCYFVSGGSEANEVAFKIARKYQLARGREGRWRIAGRYQSYHGATMATLAASGKVSRKADYAPYMLNFPHVPAPDPYRRPAGMSLEDYGRQCVEAAARILQQEDLATVAGLIVEPVSGAGSGAIVPPPGYFEGLRALCDRHDLLLIADEVITGFGRTGAAFAVEHFQALPDLITFGKGVSSGYAPLGGVLIQQRVVELLEASGSSGLFTGYTYSGHAVSCAAAGAVLRVLEERKLVERARVEGARFFAVLRAALTQPMVGDIRGLGLLAGVEFVADRETREPFAPARRVQQRVVEAALRRGLLIRGENGGLDGVRGDHILIAPPLTATRDELEQIVALLAEAVTEVQEEGP